MKTAKLCVMMFLQFMMLPVWFVPMFPYVKAMPGGEDWALWCGLIMGFGTFTSPLFGMFADRYLNAEKVLAICNFVGAALLVGAFFVTSPALLFSVLLTVMCFYMPTWAISAAIAMANSSSESFARIRIFGTLGWVASGVFSIVAAKMFGIDNFDSTRWIFAAGALVSVAGGVLSFFLPATEPAQKGHPMSVVDALGLKALVLLKEPKFLKFTFIVILSMIPFMWYNVYCADYLMQSGFKYITFTVNLGQVGEIGFMLLVPIIIRKWGYKMGFIIGLLTVAFRNASFTCSSYFGIQAFDFGAILVHGLIFGLFVVGSQMFVNDNAPKELRNQAQGLVNLLTAGIGTFASNIVFDAILGPSSRWTLAYLVALGISLAAVVITAVLMKESRKS